MLPGPLRAKGSGRSRRSMPDDRAEDLRRKALKYLSACRGDTFSQWNDAQ